MKKRTVLYAEDGYVLTNGEIYGKVLFLSDGVVASDFYEISEKEYEEIQRSVATANAPDML